MTDKKTLPLWLIALGTGSAVMGITLITPALPVISEELNALPNRVQLLLTFYLAMLATGQLIIGPLSDIYGRRVFFRLGACLIALGGFLSLFFTDISILILCRSLQGLGAAACISMGRTMLNDYFSKEDASKAMATVQTIQAVVPMLALSFGGAIVFLTGWQGVMALIMAAGIILFLGSLKFLPETHPPTGEPLNFTKVKNGYHAVLTNGLFLNFMCVSALQVGAFFTLNAFIPYAYKEIGVSTMAFGFYFAMTPLGYMTGNLFNRLYMVKKGIEFAALVGCSLSILSIAFIILIQITGGQNPWALALPCAFFGFSNGLTVANATIGGINAARAQAGTASGLIGAFTMMAGGLGGAIVVALGAAETVLIGFVSLMVMVFLSFSSALVICRRYQKGAV